MIENSPDQRTKVQLLEEIEQLSVRLDEAEQTLNAIRSGDVDALVVTGPQGDQVFSLTGAERTYRLIIETMNEAALTVDLAGTILFCNQRFSSLMKSSMAEIISRKLSNYVALAQQSTLQQLLANAQFGPVQQRLTLRASDGCAVSVKLAASPLVDSGNSSICLVASDLTELEEQANSIRVLFEQQQALEEKTIELQAANAALHQSRQAALNASEDAITARRQAEKLASRLLREVGERLQAEEALSESESLFRALFENSLDAVLLTIPDGSILSANPAACTMFGMAEEEIIRVGRTGLIDPEDPRHAVVIEERKRTGQLSGVELDFIRKNGQRFPVEVDSFILPGEPERAFVIIRDITERKQVEEQIKASLAEKEVMLREIHHRVKNNLQVISSLINLQSTGLTDEKMRDEFADVRDRVRSMALIHEKLYQTSNLARLNFADYAASLLGSLWRSHGKLAEKVRLNLEVAPVLLSIEKAVPCGLILNELAGNALKHAFPSGCDGEVTVSMERHPSADTACLRVRDNGVGLPAGMDWRHTRSLGLRLVRILAVQLHGTVDTGIGPGAELRITFPLNEAQA
jgi:PAS domain S-box-containing protein